MNFRVDPGKIVAHVENLPPYLVTLGLDRSTFERLDDLRARYFPPERNQVPAHLSMFHHLSGEEGEAIDEALLTASKLTAAIPLSFPSLRRTNGGFMALVEAPGLPRLQSSLAHSFSRWLTPQDRQPYHPHVMIMNKADRSRVEIAIEEARANWQPFQGLGESLILWRYLGGPWEEVETYQLSGAGLEPEARKA